MKFKGIYFQRAPELAVEPMFVVWCDVMGTRDKLIYSLPTAAGWIYKLQQSMAYVCACLSDEHPGEKLLWYPMMDGAYLCFSNALVMQKALRRIFFENAGEFVSRISSQSNNPKDNLLHSRAYMIRAGIAYGATYAGDQVSEEDLDLDVRNHNDAKERFLAQTARNFIISPAMTWAYKEESNAPPFGVSVHESAAANPALGRGSNGVPLSWRLWRWWHGDWGDRHELDKAQEVIRFLPEKLAGHYEWISANPAESSYPKDRLEVHRQLVKEYFHPSWLP